ncbi:MAG: hypothetical protein GX072_05005 [Lysinibacillus sp.]|nr:hypothetical protein [Lysinibacillus sp.]
METPELQTANPIIVGELKATQAIINEFVQQFKLFEFEEYAHLRNDDTDNEREFKEQLGMAEESSFDIIKAFVALNNECFLFSRKENLQLFFL